MSAVVDGTSLGAQVKMDSNALVVLEPNAASASAGSNPLLSTDALLGVGGIAAIVLAAVVLALRRHRP
ncbi:MAG: hypothetical protein JRN09_08785 [Nitrososphaerota archaeon]|nr:hypothetical protein [Nitrososphaerota archaeon]